jgi:hypothetical protein
MLSRVALILAVSLALATPSLAGDKGIKTGPRPSGWKGSQATWTQLSTGVETRDQVWTSNRIYYARTPDQTAAWRPHLEAADSQALDHVNFSRYGVLAVFMTPSNGFQMHYVYLVIGGLEVEVLPQQPPMEPPTYCQQLGCPPFVWGPPTPHYMLLSILKDSLLWRVKRLYIAEAPRGLP